MISKHILLIAFLNESELIFCTQLDGFKYYDLTLKIQLNIYHLLTQLNDQTVLFQRSQFDTSNLFAHSLNIKQTHR